MTTNEKRTPKQRDGLDLGDALQESILATLIFDDQWGGLISEQVKAVHFDEVYRPIAEKVLAYRRKFKKPPGRTHLDDLLIDILGKGDRSNRTKRVLVGLSQMEKDLNGEYVSGQLRTFLRKQQLKAALLGAAERFDQGGEDIISDLETILRDALGSAPSSQALTTINLRDVEAKQVDWVWQNRIPRGQHITMTGQPFTGKSILMLYFAAQLSRGRSNPDGTPAPRGRVILLAQEDSIETTLKPRLKALKADMSRIEIVAMVNSDKGERGFLLSEDLEKLEKLIRSRGDVLMVGIDPVTGYIGGKLDSHKATDVRAILEPLNKLAERTGALVWSITHPAKSSQSAINAFVGSQAFIAVPRMGYLVAAEEIDGKETGRVLLACVGSNIGERPTTLAYRKENVWVEPDREPDPNEVNRRYKEYLANEPDASLGRRRMFRLLAEEATGDISTVKVVWDEVQGLTISAEEIINRSTKHGDAVEMAVTFLRTYLNDGPKNSSEVAAAAAGLGISEKTLKRAKRQVCRSVRVGGLGPAGHWVCELNEPAGEEDDEAGSS